MNKKKLKKEIKSLVKQKETLIDELHKNKMINNELLEIIRLAAIEMSEMRNWE